jgi:glyoxylase-like metal-dependent hydrolase (beta-lactamase superfamily II)
MTPPVISVGQLRLLLAQDQPVTLLDIRPTAEWAEWSIPGSLHLDVYDDLKAGQTSTLDGAELPVGQPVVTVCRVGKTSQIAAERLRMRGVDALSLEGGMQAWSLAWNQALVLLPNSPAQVVQVRRTGKGCLSYLIGSAGVAAVVDPALEPDVYLALAQEFGWTIAHVIETHVHADHVSRGRALAAHSGTTLYLPAHSPVIYPFVALGDGDEVAIGHSRLKTLHTPGHTVESATYLLDQQALLTGDTLFVNGVGRPDLEASADEARLRARQLYQSLQRLLSLPPQTIVLPGHTSQPVAFDGVALASTLEQVREHVSLLRRPEAEFVESVLARLPATPPNHHRIVTLNQEGVLPTEDIAELEAGANRCAVA